MKTLKKLIALAALALFAAGFVSAEEKKETASEAKPAKCCAAAEKDGKACSHGCCVDAAKAGQNCGKCGGSGAMAKKDAKK
jgi:hypothetical protein